MSSKALVAIIAVLAVVAVPAFVDEASEGASITDAPSAQHVVDLGDYVLLKGGSPRSFDLLDSFGSQTGNDQLSSYQGIYIAGFDTGGLPGWITVEKSYTGTMYEDFVPSALLVVDPLYATGSTDYWVHSNMFGGILWVITVEVRDADPTITPDETFSYRIDFDTGEGDPLGPVIHDSPSDTWTADLTLYVPTWSGHDFVGWAADESGESLYESTLTLEGVSGEVVSITVYAVWEESSIVIPTFWDGLIELLTDPLVVVISLVLFFAVCLFIRNRTTRWY